jgi:hypothetical protein
MKRTRKKANASAKCSTASASIHLKRFFNFFKTKKIKRSFGKSYIAVKPLGISISQPPEKGKAGCSIELNCDWEPEHGFEKELIAFC